MIKFFTPIKFCYDLNCSESLVPWVTEFEELVSQDENTAVLARQSGEFEPGMYTRFKAPNAWVLAINYQDLCRMISKSSSFQLIVNVTGSQSFPPTTNVYRNGFPYPGNTVYEAPRTIWVIETPGGGSGGGGKLGLTDMFGNPIADFLVA